MMVVVTPLVSPDTESTCTATENTNTSFNPKNLVSYMELIRDKLASHCFHNLKQD